MALAFYGSRANLEAGSERPAALSRIYVGSDEEQGSGWPMGAASLGGLRTILKGNRKIRFFLLCGLLLGLIGGLSAACQYPPPTPTTTPSPTDTAIPTPTRTATPSPTPTPLPTRVPSPTPTPSPLTDAEAVDLLEEELVARGVDPKTLRISIKEVPRSLSIRYASSYDLESSVYKAQTALIALGASRVGLRVQPPLEGGISLGILPERDREVGLTVISIGWSSLQAWAEGTLSDQDFVGSWTIGVVPKE